MLFNYQDLASIASTFANSYNLAIPFPYIVLDDLADQTILSSLFSSFPTPEELNWYKYDNPLEKKLAMNHIDKLPSIFHEPLEEE